MDPRKRGTRSPLVKSPRIAKAPTAPGTARRCARAAKHSATPFARRFPSSWCARRTPVVQRRIERIPPDLDPKSIEAAWESESTASIAQPARGRVVVLYGSNEGVPQLPASTPSGSRTSKRSMRGASRITAEQVAKTSPMKCDAEPGKSIWRGPVGAFTEKTLPLLVSRHPKPLIVGSVVQKPRLHDGALDKRPRECTSRFFAPLEHFRFHNCR